MKIRTTEDIIKLHINTYSSNCYDKTNWIDINDIENKRTELHEKYGFNSAQKWMDFNLWWTSKLKDNLKIINTENGIKGKE